MHFYPQPSLLVFATGMYSSLGRQTRYIRSLQAAYWLPNSLLSAAVRDGHQRAQSGQSVVLNSMPRSGHLICSKLKAGNAAAHGPN